MKKILLWTCLLILLFPASVLGEADGFKSTSTYPTNRPTRTSSCTGDVSQTCYDVNTGETLTEDWLDTRGDIDIKLMDKVGIGSTAPNADEILIGTADWTSAWTAIADCNSAGQYLTYDTTTHTFICGDSGNYIGDITGVYSCTEGACTSITPADGSLLDMSSINCSGTTEGLYVPTSTDCSAATGSSQMCWDSDDTTLYIAANAVGAFGGDINASEMAAENFGDFTCDGDASGCLVNSDSIALTTDTTGNYVASATTGGGLTMTGTEGASLGMLATCGVNEILKWGGSAWGCVADETGGTPTFGTIATGTNTAATMTVGAGASVVATSTGSIVATGVDATGAAGITIGSADVTALTVTTADAGDGSDVVLPAGSIQSAEILDDTIALADMAHADHGDVTWGSGAAVVEDVNCSTCIDLTSEVSGEVPDANVAADLTISCTGGSVANNCLDADLQSLATPSAWRLFYSDASQNIQEITLGTNGQYLKSNGAGVAPSFDAGTGGVSEDAITPTELDDDSNTPVAGYAVIVETGAASFDYSDLSAVYQPLDATLTAVAGLTLTEDVVCSGAGLWDDADVDNDITIDSASSVEGIDIDVAGLADGKFCVYDLANTEIDCDQDPSAVGADAIGTSQLDDDANTPVAGYAVVVETGAASFDYVDIAGTYQPLDSTLTDLADGTLNEAITISGNVVNTANPWADDEVDDGLTIDAGGSVADAALNSTVTLDEEWNTEAEVEAVWSDDIIVDGDIETAALIRGIMTATEYTGTGDLVFADTPTLVTPELGAATGTSLTVTDGITAGDGTGVTYTGSNGTLTILGTGDGQDEDLVWDFNTTANTVGVSSTTLVDEIDFGAIDLTTTGIVSGTFSFGVNPTNCSAGQFPLGIDSTGDAEGCTDAATQAELNAWIGSSNITTLGTIATGVWDAGAITSSGAISGTSLASSASATPTLTLDDSGGAGSDITIVADSADANDATLTMNVKEDTALTAYVTLDGVGETVDLLKPVDVTGTLDVSGNIASEGTLALGTDPADAGAVMLQNADTIRWEASPADTDVIGISVDTSEVVQIGSAGASAVTITPATDVVGALTAASVASDAAMTVGTDITVTGNDIIFGNADSINNATDETFDFTVEAGESCTITSSDDDATAALTIVAGGNSTLTLGDSGDTVNMESSTWTINTSVDFDTMNMVTTGSILGALYYEGHATSYTITTAEGYGGFFTNDSAAGTMTFTLPDVAQGMSVCILNTVAQNIRIDPNGVEQILVDTSAGGDYLDSDDTIGSFYCLAGVSATEWMPMGQNGTWTEE